MSTPPTYVSIAELNRLKSEWGTLGEALRGVLHDTDIASTAAENYITDKTGRHTLQLRLDQAWKTSNLARDVLRSFNEEQKVLEAWIKVTLVLVNAAREMIQADNATILGREGCEKRWDTAMKALKTATLSFRE